ncbi:MAG: D-Ala-D-Ala carboxypeptidase family metallohydrolase [Prolixibacteraceae bacterium]|jgi:zinc D-Ala-D-Ala carboxypeptidase|nr:D-Ala-D-Ala carboxypeptidase family metallohydrolase [Prolixibacteraceae bacterium]
MRLSKNFELSEFRRSATAIEKGIDNTIKGSYSINNLKNLCENILQPLRDEIGRVDITSGYRSKELNEAVGGVWNSMHRFGLAADITSPSMATYDLYKFMKSNFDFDQLIAEKNDNGDEWVHVSLYPENRSESLCDYIPDSVD